MNIDKNHLTLFIKHWVSSLFVGEPNMHMFSNNFSIDNGLTLEQSITYELNQYASFSDKYDLDLNFQISIDNIIHQSNNTYTIYYSVINKKNILIFKWQITIEALSEQDFLITSNNYLSQLVHKFNINYNSNLAPTITGLNLAIKVEKNYTLKNIVSPLFELQEISTPLSFKDDGFQFASFLIKDIDFLSTIKQTKFKILYTKEEQYIIENRIIPLNIKIPSSPFSIIDKVLHINNNLYPFHIYIEYINQPPLNLFHPRNLIIPLNKDITKLIITDCLDNDWCIYNIN